MFAPWNSSVLKWKKINHLIYTHKFQKYRTTIPEIKTCNGDESRWSDKNDDRKETRNGKWHMVHWRLEIESIKRIYRELRILRFALFSAGMPSSRSRHWRSNQPGRGFFLDESQLSFDRDLLNEAQQVCLVRIIYWVNAVNAFEKHVAYFDGMIRLFFYTPWRRKPCFCESDCRVFLTNRSCLYKKNTCLEPK